MAFRSYGNVEREQGQLNEGTAPPPRYHNKKGLNGI
jgi:hypothetical protein